jgi:hypothetical protein
MHIVSGVCLTLLLLIPSFAGAANPPLSADQVMENLVRRDQERAQALRHYESTRTYRLVYQGFPGNRDAEMVVEATYDKPSTKNLELFLKPDQN